MVPARIVRLAKRAALDADLPLGRWVGGLVARELRALKLLSAPESDHDTSDK
jgi:hypothetical protein